MTDINNAPAELETEQTQDKGIQSLEELELSIAKLTANRDQILTEKRAATEAKRAVEDELTTAKTSNEALQGNYQSYVQKTELDGLLREVMPLEGAEPLLKLKLESHLKTELVDGQIKTMLVDVDGKEIERDALIEQVRANNAAFCTGVDSSGGGALGGNGYGFASRKSERPKQVGSQFGIGK